MSIGELILASVRVGRVLCLLELSIIIQSHFAVFLLDLDAVVLTFIVQFLFVLVRGVWVVVNLGWFLDVERFLEERSQVSSTDGNLCYGMWNCIAFIDWNCVSDSLTRVKNRSCGSSCREQRQDTLVSKIELWCSEILKTVDKKDNLVTL